jgi:hypothetical protein
MPREVRNPAMSQRAVFSVPVVTRDRDLAEVRTFIEAQLGRSVTWYEVIEYLYSFWKDTRGDQE